MPSFTLFFSRECSDLFANEKMYFMHVGIEILKVIGREILNLNKTSTIF